MNYNLMDSMELEFTAKTICIIALILMHIDVRSEAFMAVLLKKQVFWVITLCCWASRWAVFPLG
jgi:hypothetical protein